MNFCKHRIMVQIADLEWTREALHRACILAREKRAEIVLLKMLPVQHTSWLGTEFGAMDLSERARSEIYDYAATAEDYGVQCSAQVFQYITLAEALSEAAEYVEADIVFATLPRTLIPYWREFQLRNLRNRLTRQKRLLIEFECGSPARQTSQRYHIKRRSLLE